MSINTDHFRPYAVTVLCITDNPAVTSKVETIHAPSWQAARDFADYNYGAARVVSVSEVPND